MGRLTEAVKTAWTQYRIRRYQRLDADRQAFYAAERLEHQENGGNPYGPPPMGGCAF
jgi:hypothetical protein